MRIIKLTEETRKEALEKLIGRSPAGYPEQEKAVSEIIEAVRTRGDQAVLEYEEKFDRCKMTANQLRVTAEEIREAYESLDPAFVEVMRKAAEKGLAIIFNPSPVSREMLSYPLETVSWFLLNEIEGEALTGETDPGRILDVLAKKFPNGSVVLTLGANGAWAMDRGQRFFQPAFEVQAVDTTAAGDTFTGFFLAGISSGMPIPDALRRAAFASSIAVSRKGAADSIPTAEEVSLAE